MNKLILVLFLSFFFNDNSIFAMCEFPHNPPVVCLKGKIVKRLKVKIKDLKCFYQVKISSLIRPAKTYRYNSDLNRIDYQTPKKINKRGTLNIYSNEDNCQKIGSIITTMAIYNCSNKYASISDFDLIDYGKNKGIVHDPWNEKKQFFSCK